MNGIQTALVGRLPKDAADLRYTANGNAVLSFSVAVDDSKRREGDPTEWARVTVWGEDAERLAGKLQKGSMVYVEGRGKLRTWTNAEGQQRTDFEVSAWVCQPMGVGKRRGPVGEPTPLGAGAQPRNTRAALGLDDDDLDAAPF